LLIIGYYKLYKTKRLTLASYKKNLILIFFGISGI